VAKNKPDEASTALSSRCRKTKVRTAVNIGWTGGRRAIQSVWQLNCAGSRAIVDPEREKSDLSRGHHTPHSLAKRRYLPRAFGSLTAPAAAALSAALITTRRPVEIMEQAPLN
jgi:hypothetical protein